MVIDKLVSRMYETSRQKIRYQHRVVLFLDILGFGKLVEESAADDNLLQRVHRALSVVATGKPKWTDPGFQKKYKAALLKIAGLETDRYGAMEAIIKHWTERDMGIAFSDTLVLSNPVDWYGLFDVFSRATDVTLRLLLEGVLSRGGLALGKLHHGSQMIFGPALVEAYYLENDTARYPRIVASADLMKKLFGLRCGKRDRDLLLEMFRRDFDGLYHLHILGQRSATYSEYAYDRDWLLRNIRNALQIRLADLDQMNLNVRSKLLWFITYFNEVVKSEPSLAVKPLRHPQRGNPKK